jgi:hypothetical protein
LAAAGCIPGSGCVLSGRVAAPNAIAVTANPRTLKQSAIKNISMPLAKGTPDSRSRLSENKRLTQ